MRLEKVDHLFVFAREFSKLGLIEGVGQAARIEDQVCIQGDSLFVGEGLEREGQRRGLESEQFAHPAAQGRGLEVTRVEGHAKVCIAGH